MWASRKVDESEDMSDKKRGGGGGGGANGKWGGIVVVEIDGLRVEDTHRYFKPYAFCLEIETLPRTFVKLKTYIDSEELKYYWK